MPPLPHRFLAWQRTEVDAEMATFWCKSATPDNTTYGNVCEIHGELPPPSNPVSLTQNLWSTVYGMHGKCITASVVHQSEFLAADPDVPGSTAGATRPSEQQWVRNGAHSVPRGQTRSHLKEIAPASV
jgi:hypothetical protein